MCGKLTDIVLTFVGRAAEEASDERSEANVAER